MPDKIQPQKDESAVSKESLAVPHTNLSLIGAERPLPPPDIQRATQAPHSLTVHQALALQRVIGNRAVGQIISRNPKEVSHFARATPGIVVQRHANDELEKQVEEAELEDEGSTIQAKRETIQRHGAGQLQAQVADAKLEEQDTIQAKRVGYALRIQRHNIQTSAVHTFPIVPKAEDGKWSHWRLADAVTSTELTQIQQNIGAMIMQQKLNIREKMKLQQRLRTIEIDVSNKRTPAETPAQSFPNKLQLDTRSSTFFTPQGEVDKDTIRSTLIHEMFHCLAINHEGIAPEAITAEHKGFQGGGLALDDSTKTTETLDEAVTDWFSHEIFKAVYPKGTYKTGYFAKAGKDDNEKGSNNAAIQNQTLLNWAGEQIPILLNELKITEADLLRMYLHDHAQMGVLLHTKTVPLKQAWNQKKQEVLHTISPLSTKEGVKALITETCKELETELTTLARPEQLKLIQAEIKKKGVTVNIGATKFPLPDPVYVTTAKDFLDGLTPSSAPPSGPHVATGKINVSHIVKSLETLNLLENQAHAPLKFMVITPTDRTDTPLNTYPDSQRYGALPASSLKDLGATGDNAHDHMKGMGGAAYEAKIQTGFINTELENDYYAYLHEVGHFKQGLQDISEYSPGMNRMLLEYHNFILYENTPKHTRTRYKNDINPTGGYTFENVKSDVAGDPRMKRMVDEIEVKLMQMSSVHRELIMRNLAFEYYQEKKK